MKVSELGEFGLIDVLAELVDSDPKSGMAWRNLIVGIGDDTAAWECESGSQLATIDVLVENIHFKFETTSWEDLGWKSLAVNLSDVAAMGGLPRYALVSLTLPPETDVTDVIFFYQGMLALARGYEVAVVGGNISRSPLVTVNVAVFGESPGSPPQILTRSSAKPGDTIAVTGFLGAAAAGLEMITKNLSFDIESDALLRKAFLRPSPRVKEGRAILQSGVRCGIDISDGLISDLTHICQSSILGARIMVENVPITWPVRTNFGDTALKKALSGGEDYELLFTAPKDIANDAISLLKSMNCPVNVIGEMVDDPDLGIALQNADGTEFTLETSGWDHFAKEDRGA